MTFTSRAVEALLGVAATPPTLDVALRLATTEVRDDRYRRQPVAAGSWGRTESGWSAEVTFGPFVGGVDFDRVVVMEGNTDLDEVRIVDEDDRERTIQLAAGMTYTARVEVAG